MDDLISRQAVIDAIRNAKFSFTVKSDIDFANYREVIQEIFNNILDAQEKALNELSPAQPQSTIGQVNETAQSANDCISRKAAIEAMCGACSDWCDEGVCRKVSAIQKLPSAQPTYTDNEIQKMQDLESAEIEKAYQLGYEEGKKNAQPERKTGKWVYAEDEYGIDGYHCDQCSFFVPWDYTHKFINYIEDYHFCPNCDAEMQI